jgi:hypothetical protein
MPLKPGQAMRKVTAAQVDEAIALYQSGTRSDEICRAYDVSIGTLYGWMRSRGIAALHPRPKAPEKPQEAPVSAPAPQPQPNLARAVVATSGPIPNALKSQDRPANGGVKYTVDKYSTVVSAERVGTQLPAYDVEVEVVTTTTITLYASSLEEAIHRAKTDPKVRKVVGVREAKS